MWACTCKTSRTPVVVARHDGERGGGTLDDGAIVEARLARIAGAPVWIIEDERGRRRSVSAVDGADVVFTPEPSSCIARGWLGAPARSVSYLDASDAPVGVRNAEALAPFHRLTVDDEPGRVIVVSQRTGDVVQDTPGSSAPSLI